jgi:hypothetical protein
MENAAEYVIIIRTGMRGLAAGISGQMSDFGNRIFEMHTLPGGLYTSGKRGELI